MWIKIIYIGFFKGKACNQWVEGYFIKKGERYIILRNVGEHFIVADVVKDSVFNMFFR